MSKQKTTTPRPREDALVDPPASAADNPTDRQPDNAGDAAEEPKLTAIPDVDKPTEGDKTDDGKKKEQPPSPVIPIAACVVLAAAIGFAIAIDAWGAGLGLAVAVAVVAGLVAIWWLWRWGAHQTRSGRSGSGRGSASRRFGSRGNRAGGPTGFRLGSPFGSRSRNRGGRGTGTGTGGRNRKGLGNRIASMVPGTGAWRSRRAGRSGGTGGGRGRSGGLFGGRSRSGGLFGGRGRGSGRGGSLLGARSGGSSRSRRGGGSGGRSRRGNRGGRGRSRNRGRPVMGAPSGGLLAGIGRKIKAADNKIGEAAFTPAVHSILDAVDVVKPVKPDTDDVAPTPTDRSAAPAAGATPHHQGGTTVSVNRSQFELITESLPGVAKTDPVTNHDLGLKPMITGLSRGLDHVAAYIREHTNRIEGANWTAEDKIIVEALDAIADVQATAGPVAEKALLILESSPRWQELQAKMASPKGASADVSTGRMAGY